MQTQPGSVITCPFRNISPINTIEEGIQQGHYVKCDPFLRKKTLPLLPTRGEKTLHIVGFSQMIDATEYVELLRTEGKQPCQNALQYLLGLMGQVQEDQMPPELRAKNIVAAERNKTFPAPYSPRSSVTYNSFLCVRCNNAGRRLGTVSAGGSWSKRFVFLAEDLISPIQSTLVLT